MAGPGLPTNTDTTYPDVAADASVKLHQQHHDTVHGIVNAFDTGLKSATAGQVLKWNGSAYAPGADLQGSGGGTLSRGYVDLMDYGPVVDGTNNTTTRSANNLAFATAAATGRMVVISQPGVYYGDFNLNPSTPRFVGSDMGDVTINISPGNHFVDGNQIWGSTRWENLCFDGGKGAIRNRHTGQNVTDLHRILDCRFKNYTGAAISTNTIDGPFWKIQRNSFYAASDLGTMGIALAGLADKDSLSDNEFMLNQIDIKLDWGGNNALISNNDFVKYAAPTAGRRRAQIWFTTSVGQNNAGAGCVVQACKFGNENVGADDFRILIANEGAGTYFGDRFPVYTASTGYVSGQLIADCLVNGGDFARPFVYSTTGRYQGNRIRDIAFGGGPTSRVLEYLNASEAISSNFSDNQIGPIRAVNDGVNMPACNRAGAAISFNPPQTAHSSNLT